MACIGDRQTGLTAQTSSGFERYSIEKEGFSMEYPTGWYLEDSHEFGSVGFFTQEPLPGDEITPFVHLMIAGKYKDFSLQDQAISEKEDIEGLGTITCGDPMPVTVHGTQGIELTCSRGMRHYILEGSKVRFILNFPTEDIPESTWKHMVESITID